MLGHSQAPAGIFSPFQYPSFFSFEPQLGSQEFSFSRLSFPSPSTDFNRALHFPFADREQLSPHALAGAFPSPCGHTVQHLSLSYSGPWKCFPLPSHPCCVSRAALAPSFPSQRERKAITQHSNFYQIQPHGGTSWS